MFIKLLKSKFLMSDIQNWNKINGKYVFTFILFYHFYKDLYRDLYY
ncbi:hypothetical protein EMIT036CA2_30308 [Chryseobacterium sp. IT-36CA2]